MTAAETTWERHEAGLPARDREERARYAELEAPRRYVTEGSWPPRPGNSGIQRLHSRMKEPGNGTQQAQAESPIPEPRRGSRDQETPDAYLARTGQSRPAVAAETTTRALAHYTSELASLTREAEAAELEAEAGG